MMSWGVNSKTLNLPRAREHHETEVIDRGVKPKVIYVYESFRSTTPNFLGTLFVENVRGRESYSLSMMLTG